MGVREDRGSADQHTSAVRSLSLSQLLPSIPAECLGRKDCLVCDFKDNYQVLLSLPLPTKPNDL